MLARGVFDLDVIFARFLSLYVERYIVIGHSYCTESKTKKWGRGFSGFCIMRAVVRVFVWGGVEETLIYLNKYCGKC